jgi:hypothetical protein
MRMTKNQLEFVLSGIALITYVITLRAYGSEVAALIGGGFWGWCLAILVIGAAFRLAISVILIIGSILLLAYVQIMS